MSRAAAKSEMERTLDRLRQAAGIHGRNLVNLADELDTAAGVLRRPSKPSLVHLKSIADRVRYIGNDLLTEADCAQIEPGVVGLLARLGRVVLPHLATATLIVFPLDLAADVVTLNAAISAAETSQAELERCTDPGDFDDAAEHSAPLRLEMRPNQLSEQLTVDELKNLLLQFPGSSPVYIHVSDQQAVKLADDYSVDISSALIPELRVLLGASAVIHDS